MSLVNGQNDAFLAVFPYSGRETHLRLEPQRPTPAFYAQNRYCNRKGLSGCSELSGEALPFPGASSCARVPSWAWHHLFRSSTAGRRPGWGQPAAGSGATSPLAALTALRSPRRARKRIIHSHSPPRRPGPIHSASLQLPQDEHLRPLPRPHAPLPAGSWNSGRGRAPPAHTRDTPSASAGAVLKERGRQGQRELKVLLQNVQYVNVLLNAALDGCCTSAGCVYKITVQKKRWFLWK